NGTRAPDAAEACQLLEQVDATLLGVVMTAPQAAAGSTLPTDSLEQRARAPQRPTSFPFPERFDDIPVEVNERWVPR
ncbi:MAG: hypothetical protein LC808_26430, partial [Actinobacteria bacterium]|nr:hypothetical protein [Actinomycetota bacterium]